MPDDRAMLERLLEETYRLATRSRLLLADAAELRSRLDLDQQTFDRILRQAVDLCCFTRLYVPPGCLRLSVRGEALAKQGLNRRLNRDRTG